MKEELQLILAKVHVLFLTYGIKSLTMDDIARELKISKKTLYEYVKDKQDLVLKVVEYHIEIEKTCTCQILDEDKNAIDELMLISQHMSQNIQKVHPSVYYDLQKYYPTAWEAFAKFKNEHIYNSIKENLIKGIAQGVYRKNFDPAVIAKLYIHRMEIIFNKDIFPEDSFAAPNVYQEMILYHLHGVSNPKGKEYLKTYEDEKN